MEDTEGGEGEEGHGGADGVNDHEGLFVFVSVSAYVEGSVAPISSSSFTSPVMSTQTWTVTHSVKPPVPDRRLDGPLHRRGDVHQEQDAHGRLQRELDRAWYGWFMWLVSEQVLLEQIVSHVDLNVLAYLPRRA